MKPINIKGLLKYSMTRDGRVFLGAKEIMGNWIGFATYIFPLWYSYCKTFPKPYTIQELYLGTYGESLPKIVMNKINKTKPRERII